MVHKAEAVACCERGRLRRQGFEHKRAAFHLLDLPHLRACGLGRMEGMDGAVGAAVQEVVGKSAVEAALYVGLEVQAGRAIRGPHVVLRPACQYSVDVLPVPGGHVLHICHILESSFDFEGAYACVHHFFERLSAVHVAQREQVAVGNQRASPPVDQVEGQAAELGTAAAVGRACEAVLRGIAPPAVAHAQRTVNEGFERYLYCRCNLADLSERSLSGQHNLPESGCF